MPVPWGSLGDKSKPAGFQKHTVSRQRRKGEGEGQDYDINISGYWEGGSRSDGDQPEIYVTSQDTDRQRRFCSPHASAPESENYFGYFLRAPDVSQSTGSCVMLCRAQSLACWRDSSICWLNESSRERRGKVMNSFCPEPESLFPGVLVIKLEPFLNARQRALPRSHTLNPLFKLGKSGGDRRIGRSRPALAM